MPSPPALPEDLNRGRSFMIAAGTAHYDHLGESAVLSSVPDDLSRIVKLFTEQLGYKQVLPGLGDDPYSDYLRNKLSEWLNSDDVTAEDILVFYYSGHGVVAGKDHYLLTIDSRVERLEGTAFPTASLARMLRDSKVRNVMIVIDTCYAGQGVKDFGQLARDYVGSLRSGSDERTGVCAIAAARPKDEASQGVFSEIFAKVMLDPPENCGRAGQDYLGSYDVLIGAINDELKARKLTQRASVDLFNVQSALRFLPNLRRGISLPPPIEPVKPVPKPEPAEPLPPPIEPVKPVPEKEPADPSSLKLVRALGWLLVLVGVFTGVCGLILKESRFAEHFPWWAQQLRHFEWTSWGLIIGLPLLIVPFGASLACRGRCPRLWGWVGALAFLALFDGALLSYEVRHRPPTDRIKEEPVIDFVPRRVDVTDLLNEIRGDNLVQYAAAGTDQRRLEVLTNWAVGLAQNGPVAEALKVAESVYRSDTSPDLRLAVAQSLERAGRRDEAESVWKDAANAARDQPELERQCLALAQLARAQLRVNRAPDARQIADEARHKADGHVSQTTFVHILITYGQSLVRNNKDLEAKDTWRSAIYTCQTQSDTVQRYLTFASVARGAAEVGEVRIAREALTLARNVILSKPGPPTEDSPDTIAADVTTSFLQEKAVEDAIILAHEIQEQVQRARGMVAVAVELERSSRKSEAAKFWETAQEACEPDRDPESQAIACGVVATTLDCAGQESAARDLWSKAFLAMRRVPEKNRNRVFCEMVADLVRSRRVDRALRDAGALSSRERSAALTRIGQALQDAPEVRPKPESLQRAYKAALGIQQDDCRSPAVASVAKGLARLDCLSEARRLGGQCNRSMDKLDTYAMIMMEYHRNSPGH
jgi:tetratricopeptide (TPR) repeat protein